MQNWVLPVCNTWQNICLIRYSCELQKGWEWPRCLWKAQSTGFFSTMKDIIKLYMWGFMVDVKVSMWAPRWGELRLHTAQRRHSVAWLQGSTTGDFAQNLHGSCSQSLSPQCVFTTWSNGLNFNMYHSSKNPATVSENQAAGLMWNLLLFLAWGIVWIPSSLETHLCDFGYWGMGRLSDFVSYFHYSGRSSITFITVGGLGIRPWCWAFRGVLFFPNNWVVIHCIRIWKNHIWFTFLSSPEKGVLWSLSRQPLRVHEPLFLSINRGMENVHSDIHI